jgi:hypothetical protein
VKHAKAGLAHQPEVERGDIRVPNEDLWIIREDLGLEIGQHANGAIPARSADHCLDPRVEPHAHEIRRAALVLESLKTAELCDVRIENHFVAGALESFDSAHERSRSR